MIRAAVIGVGAMGRHHVRIYSELSDVELVGIVDPSPAGQKLSQRYQVQHFNEYARLFSEVRPDVVSIAVPTSLHHAVALAAIQAGIHVLIEKPIAQTTMQGEELVESADRLGVLLAVGHVERCNPAISILQRQLKEGRLGRIFQIHARRWSPFPVRIADVGVTLDLATHDIDVMHYLTGYHVVRAYAEIDRKAHTSQEDLLSGLLRFENGIIGVLDINWLTPSKVRELTVFGEKGMAQVNYLTQDVYIYTNGYVDSAWDSLQLFKGVGEGEMIRLHIEKREPLLVEIERFVAAVQGQPFELASGRDGLEALRVANYLVSTAQY